MAESSATEHPRRKNWRIQRTAESGSGEFANALASEEERCATDARILAVAAKAKGDHAVRSACRGAGNIDGTRRAEAGRSKGNSCAGIHLGRCQ